MDFIQISYLRFIHSDVILVKHVITKEDIKIDETFITKHASKKWNNRETISLVTKEEFPSPSK